MNFEYQEAIAILEQTPATLRSLLGELPERWTTSRGDRDDWRPYDIVGHLVHGERTDWIPRARMVIDHGTSRTFEPFDRQAMFVVSEGKSLGTLLDEFANLRDENLSTLRSWQLSAADLDRVGIHPDFGEVTLRQLLAAWVVHDLNHLFQIARVMARDYRADVGPWIEYLGVLG